MAQLETPESAQLPVVRWILPALITVLALGDGLIHFSLDFVLFRGNLFGNPFAGRSGGPPPGRSAPPPGGGQPQLPLPLNEMFVLNFVGYVVLVLLLWLAPRLLGAKMWLVNLLMMAYVAATFIAWLEFNRPNPMGLGYLSKVLEVALVIVLVIHAVVVFRHQGSRGDRVEE